MILWRWRDQVIAVALACGALWEAVAGPLTGSGYRGNAAVNALAAIVIVGVALARRTRPIAFAVAVTVATTLLWTQARGHGELPFIGYSSYMLAAYTLGAHLPRRQALVAGAVTFAVWGVPDVVDERTGIPSVHQDAGFYVLVTLALAAGVAVRHLREQSAALRQALADLAAERAGAEETAALAERHRIARDMHDVLTHTVSAVAVQAGALRLRLSPGQEAEAVAALESSSREALRELRQLLGVLRDEGHEAAPAPGLDDIDGLAAPLMARGVEVVVDRRGLPGAVAPGPALAAYRLVQESLTNVGKHAADARCVRISLDRDPSSLSITVTNDGSAASDWRPGHGLTGMRERVTAYGGELRAGPGPDGDGWSVHGVLPL